MRDDWWGRLRGMKKSIIVAGKDDGLEAKPEFFSV
jgi:hypothetical protein